MSTSRDPLEVPPHVADELLETLLCRQNAAEALADVIAAHAALVVEVGRLRRHGPAATAGPATCAPDNDDSETSSADAVGHPDAALSARAAVAAAETRAALADRARLAAIRQRDAALAESADRHAALKRAEGARIDAETRAQVADEARALAAAVSTSNAEGREAAEARAASEAARALTLERERDELVSRLVSEAQRSADAMNAVLEERSTLERWRARGVSAETPGDGAGVSLVTVAASSAPRAPPTAVSRGVHPPGGARCVAAGSGGLVATGGVDGVRLWAPPPTSDKGGAIPALPAAGAVLVGAGARAPVAALAICGARDRPLVLAAPSGGGGVDAWCGSTGRHLHRLTGHADRVTHVTPLPTSLSEAGAGAATAGADRALRLWDLKTGYCVGTFVHASACSGLSADAAGDCVVTAHRSGHVRCWDPRAGGGCQARQRERERTRK